MIGYDALERAFRRAPQFRVGCLDPSKILPASNPRHGSTAVGFPQLKEMENVAKHAARSAVTMVCREIRVRSLFRVYYLLHALVGLLVSLVQ